jgi:hypothetical protein
MLSFTAGAMTMEREPRPVRGQTSRPVIHSHLLISRL